MVEIDWCKKQLRGISLIGSNLDLGKSYLEDSYGSLKVALNSEGKWRVVTAYYACYDALYGILMKCGIKSEIHDCSIKLMELFDFSNEDVVFMKKMKQDRINSQYYRMEIKLNDLNRVKEFIFRCERIYRDLDDGRINKIRELFE
jgi:hypothetical protein